MVTSSTDTGTDRGQLVLIGAISIAFILLGVVVVFNGVQYTETINSGGASEDMQEVRTIESELGTNLETLNESPAEINMDDGFVEDYIDRAYSAPKAGQGPILVTYDDDYENDGTTVSFKVKITTNEVTVTKEIEVDLS